MFDGFKVQHLWVLIEELRNHLTFPLPVEEMTGVVLDQMRRYATVHGLTFVLIPTKTGNGYRCELNGSLHKYHNGGLHNADDFTAADLLAALNELVTTYGIDPFRSRLNGLEFGVNIVLPFPVADVLTRLISYKGVPFSADRSNGSIYYQAQTKHYIVKVYDKGTQNELPDNLLRVEVKVMTMQYLTRDNNIPLYTLADLLTVQHYPALGSLLSETFRTILFDEPLVTKNPPDGLKTSDRELLLQGRFAGYWSRTKGRPAKEQKRLKRDELRFRSLLDQYRPGRNWQNDIANLIDQKWQTLTSVTPDLLTAIDDRLTHWQNPTNNKGVIRETPENCPFSIDLSDSTTNRETVNEEGENVPFSAGCENGDLSVFYENSSVQKSDNQTNDSIVGFDCGTRTEVTAKPVDQSTRQCPITGYDISHQRPNTRFVSTSTVRVWYEHDRAKFDSLAERFLTAKQAGADLSKQCYHIAHNIRNTATNPRNNPIRPLKKYTTVTEGQTLPLFPTAETVRLTDRQLSTIKYRKGTPWEICL